jgi:hypothetical protein
LLKFTQLQLAEAEAVLTTVLAAAVQLYKE